MVQVSRDEFNRIARDQRAKAAARKANRAEKRATLPWAEPPREGPPPGPWTKGRILRKGTFAGFIVKKRPKRIRRTVKISQVSDRGALKASIVTLLGLLDRKLNGPQCRLGHLCPAYRDIGPHHGQVGYHLIPQKRGDAARFLRENVVWACSRANLGEVNNRDLYAKHHEILFGVARMARLWAISRTIKQYTDAELRELRAEIKAELEKP